MVFKSDIRGADYREKAQQALDAAETTPLDQVKRRHEAAASVWSDLADFEDRRSESARAAEALVLAAEASAETNPEADGSAS